MVPGRDGVSKINMQHVEQTVPIMSFQKVTTRKGMALIFFVYNEIVNCRRKSCSYQKTIAYKFIEADAQLCHGQAGRKATLERIPTIFRQFRNGLTALDIMHVTMYVIVRHIGEISELWAY